MKIVVGVDWSDEGFAAAHTAGRLFADSQLTLVHAVDLRPFEAPLLGPAIGREAYAEFKTAMRQAGDKVLDQTAAVVPPGVPVSRRCEFGSPAEVLLNAARAGIDLVAVGTRGRNRLAELALGSVSHRVAMHAPCATLLVKHRIEHYRRVVIAVEGYGDASFILDWLKGHRFASPPEFTVVSVALTPQLADPTAIPAFVAWDTEARTLARRLVEDVARQLQDLGIKAAGVAIGGDPVGAVVREAKGHDLIIVGSHGRQGLERFLLGSISHGIVHASPVSVLIVRSPFREAS